MDEKKKFYIPGGDRSIDLYVPITLEDAHDRLLSLNGYLLEFGETVPLELHTDVVDDDTIYFGMSSQGSAGTPLVRGFVKRWEQGTIHLRAWGYIHRGLYLFGLLAAAFSLIFLTAKLFLDPTPSVEPFNLSEPFAILLLLVLLVINAGVLIGGWKLGAYMTSGEQAALRLLEGRMRDSAAVVDVESEPLQTTDVPVKRKATGR